MKLVDTLAHRFMLRKVRIVSWFLLGFCLTFSSSLNASQFCRHVSNSIQMQAMAMTTAVFVSCFVFFMFLIGGEMLMKCEERSDEKAEEMNPSEKLRSLADDLDKKLKWLKQV